ncbi:MAG: DUF1588 domain-containing protein [Polyangia bacterium]
MLTVFSTRCSNGGCHVGGGQYPELTATGLARWMGQNSRSMSSEPLVVPGNPDASWLYRKVAGMQGAGGGALMPLGASMPIAEAAVIRDWIASGAPTMCSGDGGTTTPARIDPNTLDQARLFTCAAQSAPTSSVARIRRIDQPEWTYAVGAPDGPSSTNLTAYQNPFSNQAGAPYSTYAAGQTVDPATLDLYFLNLPEAGAEWFNNKAPTIRTHAVYYDATLDCFYSTAQPTSACIDNFVSRYLSLGVLSRAPTADEAARLRAYVVAALAREPGGGQTGAARAATLNEIAAAAWMTSGALFRSELGAPVAGDAAGRRRLTNDELALALGSVLSAHRPGSPLWFSGTGWLPPAPDDANVRLGWLQQIRAAASNGTIQDPSVMRSLLTTYSGGVDATRRDTLFDTLNDQRDVPSRGEYWLAPRIAGFFREWLGYGPAISAFKDTPGATSRFTTTSNPFDRTTLSFVNLQTRFYGHESTLVDQLDDTIARAVLESAAAKSSAFSALLTTRTWRLPSDQIDTNGQACNTNADCTTAGFGSCTTLKLCGNSISGSTAATGRVYNVENIPATSAGRWVTMSLTERSGVLTHPAWLAAHGNNFEDDASLVHRGKWVREKLFCQTVPGLENVMVQAKLGAQGPSARERVDAATTMGPSASTCLGCHSQMNTLGYPFEIYNHAGFLRATDHGHAPDGSTTITNAPDPALNTSFKSAVEFSQAVANSAYAKRCFIRQAFRYFTGRDETLEDACTLAAMESALDKGSFFDMLNTLVTSDTFLYRTLNQGDQGGGAK